MLSLKQRIAIGTLSVFSLILSVQAWADCTSPAGKPGEFKYITNNLFVCRDTVWGPLTPATIVSACTAAEEGSIKYISGDLLACKGANWVRTSSNSGVWSVACGASLSGGQGQFYYGGTSGDNRYYYCTGGGYKGIPY